MIHETSNVNPADDKQLTDEQLVTLLRQRDTGAMEYLYDHYSPALYGIIVRIVGQEALGEEVLQDVFMTVWQKISLYESNKARLFTWMLRIARNMAIDKIRSRRFKEQQKTDTVTNNVYIIDAERYTQQNPEVIGIKDLLSQLEKDHREVIEWLYFKGYTQSEVSEKYDIPLGTVKTRTRSALKKLRNLVKEP